LVSEKIHREKDTKLRKAISSQKRITITLYFIGSTAEYRTIVNLFGVSKAFVCQCIKDLSEAIVTKLKCVFLSISKREELLDIMKQYRQNTCVVQGQ
jgi:hypothetical protein